MGAFGKLFINLATALLLVALNMCSAPQVITVNVAVEVYEDTNANGQRDPDEPPIPDVLVSGRFYPEPSARTWLTDENGRALVSAQYSSGLVETAILPPCGYKANKPTTYDPTATEYQIGFIPLEPQSGLATVKFHLWYDTNQNGIQDNAELPASNHGIVINTMTVDDNDNSVYFELHTDEGGNVALDLGNSCSRMWLYRTTGTITFSVNGELVADTITSEQGITWFTVDYPLGTTQIEWALEEPPAAPTP